MNPIRTMANMHVDRKKSAFAAVEATLSLFGTRRLLFFFLLAPPRPVLVLNQDSIPRVAAVIPEQRSANRDPNHVRDEMARFVSGSGKRKSSEHLSAHPSNRSSSGADFDLPGSAIGLEWTGARKDGAGHADC